MTEAIVYGIAVGLAAAAAVSDWRTGRIPNWMTLPPLAAAPVVYLFVGGPAAGLGSVIGALVCGIIPYVLFRRDAIGGGDVKLFAALGAIVGLSVGLEGQLFAFILAAIWALGQATAGGGLRAMLLNVGRLVVNPLLPRARRRALDTSRLMSLRLGGFILAGLCLSVLLRQVAIA
jgi:prepilin peptidase CpaA